MRRAIIVFGIAVAAVVMLAGPAGAHAVLLQTQPAATQTYPTSPKVISLSFDENVQVGLGGIRLFDAKGHRIETGKPSQTNGGKTVTVSAPTLADGSYVATWRVISADGHPVNGSFIFSVGKQTLGLNSKVGQQLLSSESGSRALGVVNGVLRFVEFVSVGIMLGGFAFLLLCWPNGRNSQSTRRLIVWSWVVAFVGSVALVLVESSYAAALGFADAVKPSVVHDYIDTHVGRVLVARVIVLLVVAVLGAPLVKRAGGAVRTTLASIAGLSLILTFTLAGHARSGFQIPLAIASDFAHVAAFALWFGGLVVMLVAVLRPDDPSELEPAVSRFSNLALGAVVVLIGTGVYQGWRMVGSFSALKSTTYGRLLLVKLALVAIVVIVAAVSRDYVRNGLLGYDDDDIEEPPEPDSVREPLPVGPGAALAEVDLEQRSEVARRLRVSVAIEVVFLVLVLATTALLVDAAPARTAVNAPYQATIPGKGLNFEVLLVPSRAGPNELHVTVLKPSGALANVLSVDVEMSNPAKSIAPFKVQTIKLGPGHYTSNSLTIPFSGTWTLDIKALVTQITEVEVTASVPVRS